MQMMAESTDAPRPRPSSTVVLVRDGSAAPEIFMVKRHRLSSFGSAYAFPGGVIEAADRNVHDLCTGLSPADANRLLDLESGGLDYFSAALRELFEESGVLLCDSQLSEQQLEQARTALNDGSLGWDDFTHDNQLSLPCDRLHYFSFWITPKDQPKRYSTRFFLAAFPKGQSATHCGGELTDSSWMPAREILDASSTGAMRIILPTRKTLERIAEFDSVTSICAWAERCAENGVCCVEPAFAREATP